MIQKIIAKSEGGLLSILHVKEETPLFVSCESPSLGAQVFDKKDICLGGKLKAALHDKIQEVTILEITSTAQLDSTDEKEILIANTLIQLRAKAKIAQGDYVPDWDNNTPKYYPVFDMRNGGFVYTLTNFALTNSYSMVGSRFCFPTSAAAEKFGKDNLELYRILYMG